MNTFEEYRDSLAQTSPQESLSVPLKALWFDAKGDWDKAHRMADSIEDKTAYWVHAYLHRKEGDKNNANYWYNKAGKNMPSVSLEEEWEDIVNALL
jgi:hypothetical protein